MYIHLCAGTGNQCGDGSTTIAALGVLLGLLIFTVIGLLVIIAILAVKLQRNDRKYKGRSSAHILKVSTLHAATVAVQFTIYQSRQSIESIHWQTERSHASVTNEHSLSTVTKTTGAEAEMPVYEMASNLVTYTNGTNSRLYHIVDREVTPDEYGTIKQSVS